MNIKEAIAELRKNEKRKFEQGIDLIINLKGIDMKKDNISTIATIPHPFREMRVCGFLTKESKLVDTITKPNFAAYKDKKQLKNLIKKYDFFIGHGSLMPSVATTFGKVLGPVGKMPTPQLGVLMTEDDNAIKALLEKIKKSIKIRLKETSFKTSVGNEKMKDEDIAANVESIYNALVAVLPTKKENIRSVMLKLTMSKPVKVEIK